MSPWREWYRTSASEPSIEILSYSYHSLFSYLKVYGSRNIWQDRFQVKKLDYSNEAGMRKYYEQVEEGGHEANGKSKQAARQIELI